MTDITVDREKIYELLIKADDKLTYLGLDLMDRWEKMRFSFQLPYARLSVRSITKILRQRNIFSTKIISPFRQRI